MEAKSLKMAEHAKTDRQRVEYLEGIVSKIRILVSDRGELQDQPSGREVELELRDKLKVLTTENEQLKADHAYYVTELHVLRRQSNCLTDELSAVKLMAAETQLRQLNELKTLTEENKELRETLIAMIREQKQQPTTDEHHHGMYFSV